MLGGLLTLVVFSLPAAIYTLVQKLRKVRWGEIFEKLGLCGFKPVYLGWVAGALVLTVAGVILGRQFFSPETLDREGIAQAQYTGMTLSAVTVLLIVVQQLPGTLGEELFFRGLIGGWLVEKLGLLAGNTLQAVIFLLPHLLVLLAGLDLWPFLLAVFAGGWFLGWIRHQSGSIVPGWLIHALANAASALAMALATAS